MRRLLSLALVALILLLCTTACKDNAPDNTDEKLYHTVTFNFQNGQEPYSVKVEDNSLIIPPVDPEREGYIFGGWRRNGASWDFKTDPAFSSMDFVAQWIDSSTVFGYSVNGDGTVTVTEYKGTLDEIRLTSTISGLTVSALGDGVFKDFDRPDTMLIALPDTVASIGASAFESCVEANVVIMGSIDYIGEKAFDGCAKLARITLSDKLGSIPFRAFADCTSLKDVNIPKNVSVIGEDAFKNCASIQTIVISAKDLKVENSAFSGCTGLITVFFEGNESEWNTIKENIDQGGNGNDALLDAKVYFYSETEADGDFWYYNDKGEPRCR